MKRAVIALLIAAGLIAGCGGASSHEQAGIAGGFQKVAYGGDYYIVVDPVTNVMYAVSDGSYNRGIFTLLVDANGKPRLWEGE